jgi:diguanylate cyclase (GGDEF)-like protein
MERDWQLRMIRRNYLGAIAVLVALTAGSFTTLHLSIAGQATLVELTMLAGQEAQHVARLQTAMRTLLRNSGTDTIGPAEYATLQAKVIDAADAVRTANDRIVDLLETDAEAFRPAVPDDVRALLLESPLDLQAGLMTVVDRASKLARLDADEVRTVALGWERFDVSLASSAHLAEGFESAIREVHRVSLESGKQFERFHVGITIATLLVLAGEILVVFGPMIRRLRDDNRRIEAASRELDALAFTDPLTGLANRNRFARRLSAAVEEARTGAAFGLLLCDLNRFKAVNDGFGHLAGDALLVDMGRRIRSAVRDGDIVARLGGDEFAVILQGVRSRQDLASLAAGVQAASSAPWRWEGSDVDVSSSVGGVLCPQHSDNPDRLIAYADRALYAAKQLPEHYEVFHHDMRRESDSEAALLRDVGRAVSAGEFELHFQPKVSMRTGAVVGLEALVRWRHPSRGLILPGDFLPAIHRGGRIADLTRFVLDAATAAAADLAAAGFAPGPIAVNMPESLLVGPLCLDAISAALARHALPATSLAVEITEDVFMSRSADAIRRTVGTLSDMGVRIAFDDFGTGYAALSHLREFPFDELKIDRSFVADLGRGGSSEQITRSLVTLAAALGKEAVAEGVETEAQRDALLQFGCGIGQGYLFARPMPLPDLKSWLDGRLGDAPGRDRPPRPRLQIV